MAINITRDDVEAIARTVQSEIGHWKGDALRQGIPLTVDTIINRTAAGNFGGNSVSGVVNAPRQFTAVSRAGGWTKMPEAKPEVLNLVKQRLAELSGGSAPAQVTHFANPHYSDRKNVTGWINPMIERGAIKVQGNGPNDVHYYGTSGNVKLPAVQVVADKGILDAPYTATPAAPATTTTPPVNPEDSPRETNRVGPGVTGPGVTPDMARQVQPAPEPEKLIGGHKAKDWVGLIDGFMQAAGGLLGGDGFASPPPPQVHPAFHKPDGQIYAGLRKSWTPGQHGGSKGLLG